MSYRRYIKAKFFGPTTNRAARTRLYVVTGVEFENGKREMDIKRTYTTQHFTGDVEALGYTYLFRDGDYAYFYQDIEQ